MEMPAELSQIHERETEYKSLLNALNVVSDISREIGAKTYVFGGLTLDIWSGRFLRPHHDIDLLSVNLTDNFSNFQTHLRNRSIDSHRLENGDLKTQIDGTKVHIGNLNVKGDAVTWTHNGEKGSIFFQQHGLRKNQGNS